MIIHVHNFYELGNSNIIILGCLYFSINYITSVQTKREKTKKATGKMQNSLEILTVPVFCRMVRATSVYANVSNNE